MRPIPSIARISIAVVIACLIGCLTSCKPRGVGNFKPSEAASPTPSATHVPHKPRGAVGGVPQEARIREIAGFLSPRPQGLGKPISDRETWAAFPNALAVVDQALANQGVPVPALTDDLYLLYSQKGTRREYEDPYSLRRMRLTSFVLAECVEDKGRFLLNIEAEVAAILGERSWTLPAHDKKLESFHGMPIVDLGAADRGWILATADYLLGSRLRAETRVKIRVEIDRRVLQPYREQVLGKGSGRAPWVRADNNWNAVCHAGVIGAALALLPSPENRAWFVAAMELHIPNFLNGFTDDGYCSEGVGYWNYGFGHYSLLAQTVGAASQWQVDLYSPEIVRSILTYPQRLELFPTVCPAFSDCDPSVKPAPWILELAGVSGGKPPTPRGAPKVPLYEAVAVAFPEKPPKKFQAPEAGLPLRDSFPIAGVMVLRSKNASSGKGLAMAIKAGNNGESHNHNDLGSYVVASNGKTVLVDPGAEVYTARTFGPRRYESKVINSYGHPVPVLAGMLQDPGAGALATISSVETTEAKDVAVIDLTRAYSKSVPSLGKLTRRIAFVRSPQPVIEISDEVAFDSPQMFSTALITFGKFAPGAPGSFVVSEGSEALSVKVDTQGLAFTVKEEVLGEKLPGGKIPLRIGVSLDGPVTHAKITYRIEPVDPAAARP